MVQVVTSALGHGPVLIHCRPATQTWICFHLRNGAVYIIWGSRGSMGTVSPAERKFKSYPGDAPGSLSLVVFECISEGI
jgi:hypothetical protein